MKAMRKSALKPPFADSDEHLALISRLYHVDGLDQNEVAKLANVSQAKVSRLLALAKERGIVRISVAEYNPRRQDLEEQLRARFDLTNVMVIKSSEGMKSEDLRRTVGYFGAAAVNPLLTTGDIVALAGGRTIHELVGHLPVENAKSVTVVQAMGTVDSIVSLFDAQEVGRVMAQRLGGTFLSLNTPAFIPEKRTRDSLLELGQVRNVRERLDRATMAIVGLGTLVNSVFVERGTLNAAMIRELERAGAVGEVCGRFIDAKGEECRTVWRDRVIGLEIDQLRRIPQVIAVVSGNDRSEAILAAMAGDLVNSLLIDETGANALLTSAAASASHSGKRSNLK
jgi:deoxyribonucleoside regulator